MHKIRCCCQELANASRNSTFPPVVAAQVPPQFGPQNGTYRHQAPILPLSRPYVSPYSCSQHMTIAPSSVPSHIKLVAVAAHCHPNPLASSTSPPYHLTTITSPSYHLTIIPPHHHTISPLSPHHHTTSPPYHLTPSPPYHYSTTSLPYHHIITAQHHHHTTSSSHNLIVTSPHHHNPSCLYDRTLPHRPAPPHAIVTLLLPTVLTAPLPYCYMLS